MIRSIVAWRLLAFAERSFGLDFEAKLRGQLAPRQVCPVVANLKTKHHKACDAPGLVADHGGKRRLQNRRTEEELKADPHDGILEAFVAAPPLRATKSRWTRASLQDSKAQVTFRGRELMGSLCIPYS